MPHRTPKPSPRQPRQLAIPMFPAASVLYRLSEVERHKVLMHLTRLLLQAGGVGGSTRESSDER